MFLGDTTCGCFNAMGDMLMVGARGDVALWCAPTGSDQCHEDIEGGVYGDCNRGLHKAVFHLYNTTCMRAQFSGSWMAVVKIFFLPSRGVCPTFLSVSGTRSSTVLGGRSRSCVIVNAVYNF